MRMPMFLTVAISLVSLAQLSAAPDKPPKKKPVKTDAEKLQGTWKLVTIENNGKTGPAPANTQILFQGKKFIIKNGDKVRVESTFTLDPAKKPKTIDFQISKGPGRDKTLYGIYDLDGDKLKLCLNEGQRGGRPTEFATPPNTRVSLVVMERVKPAKGK
jgi:uncharacterized protein (TIGR03067 family)